MIKELQEQNLKLKEDNQVLEVRLERNSLRGDYDPRLTKIVHFENNPFSQEIEQDAKKMEQLIDENMKLKEVD
jgi:hypothetical protein